MCACDVCVMCVCVISEMSVTGRLSAMHEAFTDVKRFAWGFALTASQDDA